GKNFVPASLARQTLEENAHLFGWQPDLPDLRDWRQLDGETTHSVRYSQDFKGVRVDGAEVVVNMFDDARVYSVLNRYAYDIPDELDPKSVKITGRRARTIVDRLLGDRGHRDE